MTVMGNSLSLVDFSLQEEGKMSGAMYPNRYVLRHFLGNDGSLL